MGQDKGGLGIYRGPFAVLLVRGDLQTRHLNSLRENNVAGIGEKGNKRVSS